MKTVKDLIEDLKKEDPKAIVVMSKDGEGNNFSPFCECYDGAYKADSTWSGEFGEAKLTPELEKEGFTRGDIIHGSKAVCLYPVN